MSAPAAPASTPSNVEAFLLEVVELTNTTLDLNAQLASIAQVTRRVIDYEIFSILLLNEKTQELRMRFEIGHSPEVADRLRIKVGKGITGQAVAQSGEAHRIVARKYDGGLATAVELFDAAAEETGARLGYADARYQAVVALAQRRRAAGLDLDPLTTLEAADHPEP